LVSQVTDFSKVDIDSRIKHDPRYAKIWQFFDSSVLDYGEASFGTPCCGPCGEKSGVAAKNDRNNINPAFQMDRGVFFGTIQYQLTRQTSGEKSSKRTH
jgi:hypothetical protein